MLPLLCCAPSCLQVSDLYDPRTQWASYIINAIKAKELFVKDVNYIVKKDEVRDALCTSVLH
jgi:preprotein translocase subunit SecA